MVPVAGEEVFDVRQGERLNLEGCFNLSTGDEMSLF